MEPAPQGPRHEIDRDIYGMPAFTSLQTSDLTASRRWWTEGPESLIHLRRYRYQDVLLVGGRPAGAPKPVGSTISFAHPGPSTNLLSSPNGSASSLPEPSPAPTRCRGSRSS